MFNQEKPEVAAAQKVMLEILKEIHKICVENNITYWLTAGTLLGAVRHKGFIPWDDDCDVAMPREDFIKFLRIAPKLLPGTMHLQNKRIEPCYLERFTKIRKDGTIFIEKGETGEESYHHGVFVDIFPFDGCKYEWLIKLVHWRNTFKDKKNGYEKGSIKRLLITIYTNVIMSIPVMIVSFIVKTLMRFPDIYMSEKSEAYYTYGFEFNIPAKAVKKNMFIPANIEKNCFEGYEFYLPNNVHSVLCAEFGEDYMTLPPVEKRKTHSKYIKVGDV